MYVMKIWVGGGVQESGSVLARTLYVAGVNGKIYNGGPCWAWWVFLIKREMSQTRCQTQTLHWFTERQMTETFHCGNLTPTHARNGQRDEQFVLKWNKNYNVLIFRTNECDFSTLLQCITDFLNAWQEKSCLSFGQTLQLFFLQSNCFNAVKIKDPDSELCWEFEQWVKQRWFSDP